MSQSCIYTSEKPFNVHKLNSQLEKLTLEKSILINICVTSSSNPPVTQVATPLIMQNFKA